MYHYICQKTPTIFGWMLLRNGGLNMPKYLNLINNPEAKSYAFDQAIYT